MKFGLSQFPDVKFISFLLCPRTFDAPCKQKKNLSGDTSLASKLKMPHFNCYHLNSYGTDVLFFSSRQIYRKETCMRLNFAVMS